jgi:hypothetical protein
MDPVRLLVISRPEGFGEHRSIETGTAVRRCSGSPGYLGRGVQNWLF